MLKKSKIEGARKSRESQFLGVPTAAKPCRADPSVVVLSKTMRSLTSPNAKRIYAESVSQVFSEFWSRHPRLKFCRQLFRVLHDHRVLADAAKAAD